MGVEGGGGEEAEEKGTLNWSFDIYFFASLQEFVRCLKDLKERFFRNCVFCKL